MGLLLVMNENKSHCVYIKDSDKFMFCETKNKNNKYFCKNCLQCFRSKNVLIKHKNVCLSINSGKSIRLEKGTIKFENHFKQTPVTFFKTSQIQLKKMSFCDLFMTSQIYL